MINNIKAISTGLKVNRKTALKMAAVEFLKNKKVTEIHLATYNKLKIVITYKGPRNEEAITEGMEIVRVVDREAA